MTHTFYSNFYLNHRVNIQSGLGLSRVVGEKKIFLHIFEGKPQDIMWWHGLQLLETVWVPWTLLQTGNVLWLDNIFLKKWWDITFTMTLDIAKKNKFPMDLHIMVYHLNHWLLSLYAFKYLHYSVTLLSQGWN